MQVVEKPTASSATIPGWCHNWAARLFAELRDVKGSDDLGIQPRSLWYPLENMEKTMANYDFSWVNQLFQWPFSIANCSFTRGIVTSQESRDWLKGKSSGEGFWTPPPHHGFLQILQTILGKYRGLSSGVKGTRWSCILRDNVIIGVN